MVCFQVLFTNSNNNCKENYLFILVIGCSRFISCHSCTRHPITSLSLLTAQGFRYVKVQPFEDKTVLYFKWRSYHLKWNFSSFITLIRSSIIFYKSSINHYLCLDYLHFQCFLLFRKWTFFEFPQIMSSPFSIQMSKITSTHYWFFVAFMASISF